MSEDRRTATRHLRVMHACEKGATGVYWGHRTVASVLFRNIVKQLTEMHAHEVEHFAIFGDLMKSRGVRHVVAPFFWCAGGIVYGVATAMAGKRAIWKSTAVIEAIVERELLEAASFFKAQDPEIYAAINRILIEEIQHKQVGELHSQGVSVLDAVVKSVAQAGATASKKIAERL
jgi:ubiquinone biosynthesis monooxygenase Coq7